MKTALVTGVTGQDGSYLAEFLLDKGYDVHGCVRRSSVEKFERIAHIRDRITLHQMDLLDQLSIITVLEDVEPREVYNLAAQSFVMLEGIRTVNPDIRFYQASSSEMFGRVRHTPQNEETPFYPRSPYGVAKVYGHFITVNYRESYGLFAASGILFNHESPRRGLEFVTRKVSDAVARIKLGRQQLLHLGNLEAQRDWGYAGDYVDAMWRMLQRDEPEDFVIGTGAMHSVRDLVKLAFAHVGFDWQEYVMEDPTLFRPAEVEHLCADASKARRLLDWEPLVDFEELVKMMVDSDLALLGAGD
jgi:GDPmannose 4,6-dehydratase